MRSLRKRRTAWVVVVAPVVAALVGESVYAQSASGSSDGTTLNKVVVTGSRIKRSVGDSDSPIDVISGAELQKLGASNVVDALNQLLPSFNLPAVPGQDQSAIVRPPNLRGLNGDQTLVLVNGKRRHASAVVNANSSVNKGSQPVDLNTIPFSAIDHIEVLRDGAAAQYGSDAIAGVINIFLKTDDAGGELTSKVGGYDFKDGFTWQEGLNKGFKLGEKGYINLSGEYLDQRHTDRSLATLPQGGSFYYPLPNGDPDPREAGAAGQHRVVDGLPDVHTINLSYNAGLPIFGGAADLYSFATYTHRIGNGYENFRYANSSRDPTYCPDGVGGTPSNPYCQTFPDGFEPQEVIYEEDFSTTLGAKGKVLGWNWDASSTYGKDDASVSVINTINATIGPNSPTTLYDGSWINTELTNNLDISRAFDIGLKDPLSVAFGLEHRNNSYATKAGQPESYEYGPNDACLTDINAQYCSFLAPDGTTKRPNPGAQSYAGFRPSQSGHDYRDNFAGYFDLEGKPLPQWDLGIAGRFEHYDDFGNTRTGKISTRYAFTPHFAVRGTISNGFRAPTLGQSLYATSSTFFQNGQPFDIVTTPVGSDLARSFGATALQPEKSTNYSVGFVATPVKNLDVTIDAYRIYVRHRISETGYLGPDYQGGTDSTGTPVIDYLFPAGTNPQDLQYFGNLVDTRTQGLDIIANYRTNFHHYGLVRWTAQANWNQTTITGTAQNPSVFQQPLGPDGISVEQANPGFANVFDPTQQGYLTVATPRNKVIVGADYLKGPFKANLRVTRYGKVIDTTYSDAEQYLTPKAIVDLDLSYDINSLVTVGLGANNLLNTYPPETTDAYRAQNGTSGFGKYSPLSPYGYFGGFYYGRVVVHF